jgi:hypothetical protein
MEGIDSREGRFLDRVQVRLLGEEQRPRFDRLLLRNHFFRALSIGGARTPA